MNKLEYQFWNLIFYFNFYEFIPKNQKYIFFISILLFEIRNLYANYPNQNHNQNQSLLGVDMPDTNFTQLNLIYGVIWVLIQKIFWDNSSLEVLI